jgi:hypothetical protein
MHGQTQININYCIKNYEDAPMHFEFVVDKVALQQALLLELPSPPDSVIPSMLNTNSFIHSSVIHAVYLSN